MWVIAGKRAMQVDAAWSVTRVEHKPRNPFENRNRSRAGALNEGRSRAVL
jgi:hypothetical protein